MMSSGDKGRSAQSVSARIRYCGEDSR